MCLATVFKESDDSVIFKNVARIDVDGNKLILRDIMGDERVVEGSILMVDLANSIVTRLLRIVQNLIKSIKEEFRRHLVLWHMLLPSQEKAA